LIAREKIKVCFVSSVFARYDGDRSASFLIEEIKRLQMLGYIVKVFAPSFRGLKNHSVYGIEVYRFRYFFEKWENLTHDSGAPNKIRNPLYLFIALFYIVFGSLSFMRISKRERWDIIHVHWPFPHGIFGFLGSRVCGARVISSFHGAELLLQKKYPFVRRFLEHAIRNSRFITSNSTFTASEINKIVDTHVEIIPYGVTIEKKYKDIRIQHDRYLLFVGRLIQRKGVRYLIEAMEELNINGDLKLYIVGEGDQKSYLQQLVRAKGLENVILFQGFVPNEMLDRFYNECKAFVLPAIVDDRGDTEGLGIVLIEALMYKKPVIASNVGGIGDIVKDGETGLLVPEKSSKAIVDAVEFIMAKPDVANELGERGYSFIEENFSWKSIIHRVDTLYQRVFDGE
jgi:glycosyltransferase involved in cell wall biosynthesis